MHSILIVGADTQHREELAGALRPAGRALHQARDDRQAASILTEKPVTLVIVDSQSPVGADALEVMETCKRAIQPGSPAPHFIFVGRELLVDPSSLLERGAEAVFRDPLSPSGLRRLAMELGPRSEAWTRACARTSEELPVGVKLAPDATEWITGRLVNLSKGGFLAEFPGSAYRVGQRMLFALGMKGVPGVAQSACVDGVFEIRWIPAAGTLLKTRCGGSLQFESQERQKEYLEFLNFCRIRPASA